MQINFLELEKNGLLSYQYLNLLSSIFFDTYRNIFEMLIPTVPILLFKSEIWESYGQKTKICLKIVYF